MNLSDVFSKIAWKRVAPVDIAKLVSNQHEFDGVQELREFFGTDQKLVSPITWHIFTGDDVITEESTVTFYDARAKSASRTGRSEWRLYYPGEPLRFSRPDDLLVLALTKDGQLHGLLFGQDSGLITAVFHLFEISSTGSTFGLSEAASLHQSEIDFTRQQIIEALGLEQLVPVEASVFPIAERVLEAAVKDGLKFPSTKTMAEEARKVGGDVPGSPDGTLMTWLDAEYRLFRAVEEILVSSQLGIGFDSVDTFISYSLSVQNRRKSRMGLSLQHHLAELFTRHGLRFQPQMTTEAGHRPDFVFPGATEYWDPAFAAELLVMLAVKSTCKDRWPQVLPEAERIPTKHLFTLDVALTGDTLVRMRHHSLIPVVPEPLIQQYEASLQDEFKTLAGFIEHVRSTQA